jgi:transposase/predicted DNA-binding protein YlxM (UPF0122 family)
MTSEVETRKLIIKFFQENPRWTLQKIAKEAKVHRQTVSDVIRRFKKDLTVNRKIGSGRKSEFYSPKKVKKVINIFRRDPNTSVRKMAQKVDTSATTVQRIKTKSGLKSYKVQKVPDRNTVKNVEAKKRAAKLKKDFFQKHDCCIMDDETYVYYDFKQLPGQEHYVADARGNVFEQFRTKKVTKFPKKHLVWQAICSCGQRSKFLVFSGSINSNIYIEECLKKGLLPLLRSHSVSTFFWPDLASSHYSKATLEWYKANGVNFVPKEANPPNCPELRPIEKYWAQVKRILKETKQVSKNETDFKRKWRVASGKVSETTIKTMMGRVPEKIQEFCKQ